MRRKSDLEIQRSYKSAEKAKIELGVRTQLMDEGRTVEGVRKTYLHVREDARRLPPSSSMTRNITKVDISKVSR